MAAKSYGNLQGIIFFQGETDSLNPIDNPNAQLSPDNWADLFSDYVTDIRNDLSIMDLPIVFAQIGNNTNFDKYINWEIVKKEQELVDIPFVVMIKTDDLYPQDEIHFSTENYQKIGERFAKAYMIIVNGDN